MIELIENPYKIETVVVYCSSRSGDHPKYAADARALGTMLAKMGFKIVYGSGASGLMGEFARAAVAAGGNVTGIINPEFRYSEFYQHVEGVNEIIVPTRDQRKKEFIIRSQASIALPGGLGTFEEYGVPLADGDQAMSANLNEYVRPHLFLNTKGFYTPLKKFFDHANKKNFIHDGRQNVILFVKTAEEAVNKFVKWNNEGIMRYSDIPRTPAGVVRDIGAHHKIK